MSSIFIHANFLLSFSSFLFCFSIVMFSSISAEPEAPKDGTTEEVKTEQPAEPQTEGDQVKSEEKQEEKPSEAPQGNYRDFN